MESEPKPLASVRRRRWYQFTLGTLLVFMLLAAATMSWFAVKLNQARGQKEVVEAILKMGGSVVYDNQMEASDKRAEPPGPAWLREWLGVDFLATVGYVSFEGTQVTDAGLELVRGLPQLQWLNLFATQVTDAGLNNLKGLRQLRVLNLGSTRVTDAGMVHLKGLTKLQSLSLDQTEVTDAGLEHLQGLTQLDFLVLDDTQVTDGGLEQLAGLTQLKELSLNHTRVTDDGVKRLHQTLPKCRIAY